MRRCRQVSVRGLQVTRVIGLPRDEDSGVTAELRHKQQCHAPSVSDCQATHSCPVPDTGPLGSVTTSECLVTRPLRNRRSSCGRVKWEWLQVAFVSRVVVSERPSLLTSSEFWKYFKAEETREESLGFAVTGPVAFTGVESGTSSFPKITQATTASWRERFFLRFYLFIFRERGRRGKRERETSMCGCLSHAPN